MNIEERLAEIAKWMDRLETRIEACNTAINEHVRLDHDTVNSRLDSLVSVLSQHMRLEQHQPIDIRLTKPPLITPMLLWCPSCGQRHLDVGEFETKPHHTHACQKCGMVWRPALIYTRGVQFLPGFKNA